MARTSMHRVGAGILLIFLMLVTTTAFIQPAGAQQANPSQISLGSIRNLSNDAGNSTAPVVAAVGSHVYVAWEDKPANHHPMTYFTTSGDNGSTWSPVAMFSGLPGGASPQTSAVQIAAEGPYVFLTWEQKSQTAYAISSDYGATFKYNLFNATGSLAGTMSAEAVTACGSYAYFTWADIMSLTNSRSIIFVQAGDSGGGNFTFTAPKVISTGTTTSGEDESACVGNYVYVVWDSIWFTVSSNNGQTWGTPKQLDPAGGGREPKISASATNVYVAFPSNAGGSYQTYIVVSNNNGATFAPAKIISTGMTNAREVEVAPSGNYVFVTSRSEKLGVGGTQQFVYTSHDSGATFSAPILLGKLPNPENGFGGVTIDGSNVYIQWIHRAVKGGVQQIFLSASQDNGATWSAPQQVSLSTAGTVGYGDPAGGQGPMVAGNLGNVYVVWQDNTTGGGDIYFIACS